MKRSSAVLALTALTATVALAQQTSPPAEPPASTPSTAPAPADPNATPDSSSDSSSANKQALMKDCMTQVKAANPGVPNQDIKNFCDKQINQPSPPHE